MTAFAILQMHCAVFWLVDRKGHFMTKWFDFWQEYPRQADSDAYLQQVGKTVGGMPITEQQLRTLVRSVKKGMVLQRGDRVLDLCCGNGIITKEIAKECEFVVGIDFSKSLIDTAMEYNSQQNIKYIQMDVLKMEELLDEYRSVFNKGLWYEALAFFDPHEFEFVLKMILEMSDGDPIIFVGSVLDKARIWNFFNTFLRKFFYVTEIILLRREVGLGRWWRVSEVQRVCRNLGFRACVHYQDPILHTAHYRFDVTISKGGN